MPRTLPLGGVAGCIRHLRLAENILIEDGFGQVWMMAPAAFVTPGMINHMAGTARGIVSLAMELERFAALGLSFLPRRNGARDDVDVGISFEACEGVTTGISAQDRALTVRAAAQDPIWQGAITTPGHVIPLIERPEGLTARAGVAEGSSALLRAAGLPPLAVVCAVLTEDGRDCAAEDVPVTEGLRGLAFLSRENHAELD